MLILLLDAAGVVEGDGAPEWVDGFVVTGGSSMRTCNSDLS